jgi:hypothetical protein
MRLDHPVFVGPLVPKLALETRPGSILASGVLTPELPETVDVWKVQNGLGHTGALASPWGFGDSPDTEWIASGPNAVSPLAVALGRHGNVFLWGFSAAPDRMTEGAGQVFVNTVVHMARHRTPPLVTRHAPSRMLALVHSARITDELTPRFERFLRASLGPTIQRTTGLRSEVTRPYISANLEYLHNTKGGLDIDETLQRLRISNRSLDLLDLLDQRLRSNPQDPEANLLLRRYVRPEGFESPLAFTDWLARNRERLFFSDVGGFRWFARPAVQSR